MKYKIFINFKDSFLIKLNTIKRKVIKFFSLKTILLSLQKYCKYNWTLTCSGGPDSIFIMLLLHLFFYKKINVINFNHKTRMLYCKNEENLIFFYCKVLNINFFVNSVHETVFEKKQTFFRIRRILNFNKFLIWKQSFIIFFGHHFSDLTEHFNLFINLYAYEKNFLFFIKHKLISTKVKFLIIKPFVWLSKNNIISILITLKIFFLIDKTNYNVNYSRNYLRNKYVWYLEKNIMQFYRNYNKIKKLNIRLFIWQVLVFKAHLIYSKIYAYNYTCVITSSIKILLYKLPFFKLNFFFKKNHFLLTN